MKAHLERMRAIKSKPGVYSKKKKLKKGRKTRKRGPKVSQRPRCKFTVPTVIDTNAPKSHRYSQIMTDMKKRERRKAEQRHEHILRLMHDRIATGTSMSQRRKNPADPIANPVRIIRNVVTKRGPEWDSTRSPRKEHYFGNPFSMEMIPAVVVSKLGNKFPFNEARSAAAKLISPQSARLRSKAPRRGGSWSLSGSLSARRPISARGVRPSPRTRSGYLTSRTPRSARPSKKSQRTTPSRAEAKQAWGLSAVSPRAPSAEPAGSSEEKADQGAADEVRRNLSDKLRQVISDYNIYKESDLRDLLRKVKRLNLNVDPKLTESVIQDLEQEMCLAPGGMGSAVPEDDAAADGYGEDEGYDDEFGQVNLEINLKAAEPFVESALRSARRSARAPRKTGTTKKKKKSGTRRKSKGIKGTSLTKAKKSSRSSYSNPWAMR